MPEDNTYSFSIGKHPLHVSPNETFSVKLKAPMEIYISEHCYLSSLGARGRAGLRRLRRSDEAFKRRYRLRRLKYIKAAGKKVRVRRTLLKPLACPVFDLPWDRQEASEYVRDFNQKYDMETKQLIEAARTKATEETQEKEIKTAS
jgi:hypothetical protein